ncbi:universal stress protein [Nocardioides ganghwensis]|jgi:nucleotide-binding universal stress UspA family protein|uniref:Universal stress protein n=1 Tax=Nocardioides ganghwensis TaxID=252230 RepID=A0A4Q2SB62_9ACTN|nr:universal stress protein [Nocardioides ganghwensis]MBD3944741.1 universal stress protein [Nocardioides ganghwensis]RYC00922.1 universal stress protein [Nocardioides ganghwensis]
MHVIVATDGSKQSLAAAKHLKSFADPTKITEISVVAVVRPLASVAFADDVSENRLDGSFRDAAQSAVDTIAGVFEGWGPKVSKRIRSGSAANEIIKAAKQYDAGLVVVAAGGRGLSDAVLVGSTAQRVQHYAPCPVLVVRPAPRKRK